MWNMGGMVCKQTNYDKIKDPMFIETIKGHDIIALVETHLPADHPIALDGYYHCRRDRPKSNNGRHFGGWAVFIRKSLRKLGIKVVEQSPDFVWLKVCKGPFQLSHDIYICVAYIPPCDSSYLAGLDVDLLEQVHNSVSKYTTLGQIILMGDLNGRTGRELDFISRDNDKPLPLDLPYVSDKQIAPRNSLDTVVNNRGRNILDMCISAKLRIVNGRKLGDTLGYYTCHKWNGSSVVDYAIVSEDLLDVIPYFQVQKFMADLSDHCCISLKVDIPVILAEETEDSDPLLPLPTSFKWDNASLDVFQEALVSPGIQAEVKEFMNVQFTYDEHGVNCATEGITNIFQMAADKSLKKKKSVVKHGSHRGKPRQQPWFNKTLRQQRQSLLSKGWLMAKFPGDPIVRGRYYRSLKEYRKNCKRECRQYRQDLINKLNNLHDSHPKAYWDLVKKLKDDNSSNIDKINPSDWFKHFQSLGKSENFTHPGKLEEVLAQIPYMENVKSFTELDFKINKTEILQAIKDLKNGKACGPDGICNELIKYSINVMLEPIQKVFNLILTSGTYPVGWAKGIIKPLHKKEDPMVPNNYRGITLTSVIGKLFNSVLNNRILNFLKKHRIMRSEQIGFRPKCRTSDHIFVIKALMDKYKKLKKPIFMCFIDFQKAFDSISHPCLLYKLLKMNLNGCIYKLIKDMYSKNVLQVNTGKGLTKEFTSDVGVRQGDNLSPTLFNLFVNDIPDIFDNSCDPVTLHSRSLNCLLYADDLVLLSHSTVGIQNAIDKLCQYCNDWGLTINPQKTKAFIASTQRKLKPNIYIGGTPIDCVDEVTYLGIVINKNGTFKSCLKTLYNKGLKAMFKLRKVMWPPPNPATSLHLFDHLIRPILLYGSEIWCFSLFGNRYNKTTDIANIPKTYAAQKPAIEQCLIKYCKYVLGIPKNADNCVIYGELGLHPLYIDAIDRMLKYWHYIENVSDNELLLEAYACVQDLQENGHNCWLNHVYKVKSVVNRLNDRQSLSLTDIRHIKAQLQKQYATFWETAIMSDGKSKSEHGRKLRTYRKFKYWFGKEAYLDVVANRKWRMALTKFRVSAHRLMIELGRRTRTAVEHRLCPKCSLGEVEDEWHFLSVCPIYTAEREKLLTCINKKSPLFKQLPYDDQLCWIMSNKDEEIIMKLRYPE
jgi:hypothetical protein